MNPQSGRFQTMDTFEGVNQDPLTLHKYLYANADPINRLDPSGHEATTLELQGAMGLQGSIIGIAFQRFASFIAEYGVKLLVAGALDYTAIRVTTAIQANIAAQKALEQERVKTKTKVKEAAKNTFVLFHYTGPAGALGIAGGGFMFVTPLVEINDYIFPHGAYATEIPPWDPGYTQRSLSTMFYGTPDRDVSWFVALDGKGFVFLPYAAYPHQWVKPGEPGTTVPVTVIMIGPNLMLP